MRRIKLSTSLINRAITLCFFYSIFFRISVRPAFALCPYNPLRSSDSYTILALICTCRLSVWTVIVMLVESCHTDPEEC